METSSSHISSSLVVSHARLLANLTRPRVTIKPPRMADWTAETTVCTWSAYEARRRGGAEERRRGGEAAATAAALLREVRL